MFNDTISYKGKQIAYFSVGTGNTVFLLHGFLESKEIWVDFANELSKNHRVVCIDLPGHGKSQTLGDIHSMEEMADLVKFIADYLNIDKFVLIGHSMGGYVSLSFAEKYSTCLKGLGLFHSHALADSEEAKINRDRACEIVLQNKHKYIANFIPDLFAPENIEKYRAEIKKLQENVANIEPEAIIASQKGMKARTDKLNLLIELEIPIMFIAGKQDSRAPFQNIMAQAMLPKHSEILALNVGHMGYIEAKKETLNFTKSFIINCFDL